MPELSIIMGVYNGAKTLARAIDSILNQTYRDFEFIICDDNSSDTTLVILKEYAEKDCRLIVLHNEKNLGLAASLNRCIDISKGNFIGRMDDDDVSHAKRFERQLAFAKEHPEYSVVGTTRFVFDEDGVWGQVNYWGELRATDIFKGKVFSHPTVIMRREALQDVGNYTISSRTIRGQDFDLWCKLYSAGYKGYIMEDTLLYYYESRYNVKRAKWKQRVDSCQTHLMYRKKMGVPLWYSIYAYKSFIVALVPLQLLSFFKRKKRST